MAFEQNQLDGHKVKNTEVLRNGLCRTHAWKKWREQCSVNAVPKHKAG